MKKFLLILFIGFFEEAQSQGGITFSSTFLSDDNVFKNVTGNYSNIITSDASVFYNHFVGNSQLKFSYGLNLNSYNNYSAANNNTNSFDLGYALNSDDEEQLFICALSYTGKSVKDEYQLYKEQNLNFNTSYDFSFNDIHSGQLRYGYNKISYDNFSDFSYTENIFGYTSTFTWQTKTSLFFDASIGYKKYSNDVYLNKTDSNQSPFWTPKGTGPKKIKTVLEKMTSTTKMDNNNTQLLISGKIAQSLLDNLGSFFVYSFRYNVENNSRPILVSDYYFSDDNLFDDHYGYGGHEMELGITYMAPFDITLKSTVEYLLKNYTNNYPDNNNILRTRTDNKVLYTLRLSRSFGLFDRFFEKLSVYFFYIYQNNNSDINFFDYKNNIFAIGMNTTFKF
jgi:hypothetical protein